MVAIDQYETLIHIDYERERDPDKSLGHQLCRVVNSFLATRNPAVSYKVGVRPYAWGRELRLLALTRDSNKVATINQLTWTKF